MLRKFASLSELNLPRLNEMVESINRAANPSVGPGLNVQRAGGRASLSLSGPAEERRGAITEDCTGGTLQEIVQTQATDDNDDWSRADDDCPVSLEVITDIEYNQTSHILAFRTRLLTFDRCGKLIEIAAEGEPTTITEAEAC